MAVGSDDGTARSAGSCGCARGDGCTAREGPLLNEYSAVLARIHHETHGDLARAAGPAIATLLRRSGIRGGVVVDLGCGTGILARQLLRSGYDVVGVDPSQAMLRIARRVAPSARFVRSRAEDFELPACVAVVATGEALTYIDSRAAPVAHLRRHIRRVSAALVPGGLFIFDAIREGRPELVYRTWRAGRDWVMVTESREDRRRRAVTRRITTFARAGSTYRRQDAQHRVGVYAKSDVLRELRARGFIARTLRGYGSSPLAPRRLVFHAVRPTA